MIERKTNIIIAILSVIVGLVLIFFSFYAKEHMKIGYYTASIGFLLFGIVMLIFYKFKKK